MKKKTLIISLLTASTMLVAGNYSRANDIVTDYDTGLQWQDTPYTSAEKAVYNSRTKESGRVTKWINAKDVCTKAGNGWRLASIKELKTLVDTNYYNPAMDPIFKSGLGLGFWSSTLSATAGSAQGVGFASGKVHNCGINGLAKFVRCVRKSSGGGTTPPPTTNNPPIAKAGSNQSVIEGEMVTLDGSGSNDPDGEITAYVWKENATVLSKKASFDRTYSIGTHTITLTVTDNDGATKSDSVTVTVKSASSPTNNPPAADAGSDKTVQVNHTVTISGSGSDSDGTIVSYQWKKKSNGYILANTKTFDFTPSGTKPKTLVLTVTDDGGAKATDEMILTVTDGSDGGTPPPSGNNPPAADAGSDKTVQVNHTVTISGSGSSDSDGGIVSYRWTRNGTFHSNKETFVFRPSGTKPKTFELTVTDDDGATATDKMVLTVTK